MFPRAPLWFSTGLLRENRITIDEASLRSYSGVQDAESQYATFY